MDCEVPWLSAGDFNTVLSPLERLGGHTTDAEMQQFQDCVSICCMEDVPATGALFTWSYKQEPNDSIYSRLDRMMDNQKWFAMFADYVAHFHPEGLFDHCPSRDSFLMQKAKIQWSLEGDLNTSYFNHIIKKRVLMNKILQIEDKERGGRFCTDAHALILSMPVTIKEIKTCLFSISKEKSPGPAGYTSLFFRDAWEKVGEEISGAILNFFDTGKMLAQINSTVITLIPKVDRPSSVKHFRPIACCNVLYKTISKLICNRGNVSPRCMFKLDLQKAYDTTEWQFLEQMLAALQFPEKFIQLVMCCVTSTTFTLNLNGVHFGYFNGRRGLRQGDPLSPLLFTICMEYLTRILEYVTQQWHFRYLSLCNGLKLNHLLFADDLLMFCKGDVRSIMLMLRAMATFSAASGLKVNASKSEVVFNGVADDVKADIIHVSGFKEGGLPFTYLGIPIQPTRLTRLDCSILIDKTTARVRSIGARKLSYAGRLTLINAVFNTLHNYWASIFIIPNKKEGGLGIKQTGVWNIATVGKLVNWIYTKADRLWVLWIDHVYLKGRGWNSYQPPADSNWNWQNICKDIGNQGSSIVKARIRRVAMLACWYLIWLERNRCRYELMLARPEKIGKEFQMLVKQRIQHFIQKPVGNNDKNWLV
ncbi:uncharacterized protein LOC141631675 [Silene latifolia]|uniref:uncharacterized protein LOC141631675 n=1 Tax=Silene latifolia TaxID=37657 RepID=UPI003D787029